MRLDLVREVLEADVLSGDEHLDIEVFSACGSDLMSDVLAFVKDQSLLLTGLTNPQVVRTAEMMDMKAIIFVRGKKPDEDIIALAKEHEMVMMTTKFPLYIASGRLYSAGLTGKEVGQQV